MLLRAVAPPTGAAAAVTLGTVVLYALLPVASTVAGAVVAALRPPGAVVRSYIQHFAAGVVFSIVADEILADLTRIHAVSRVIVGFSAGVAAMLALRTLTRRLEGGTRTADGAGSAPSAPSAARPETEARAGGRGSLALLATVAIDVVIDGLLVGMGFAAGGGAGRLLAFAMTVEVLSLGLAVVVQLGASGASHVRAVVTTAGLALLLVPSAVVGATALRGVSEPTLATVLAFGAAALLFLVTEELLVEAHEVPETPVSTATFFLGFLAFYVLDLVA